MEVGLTGQHGQIAQLYVVVVIKQEIDSVTIPHRH